MSNFYETKKILNGIKSFGLSDASDLPKIYIGQKVVILCGRYQYRGILVDIVSGFVILANCRTSFPFNHKCDKLSLSSEKNLEQEDDINGPVLINVNSIEMIYRPLKWADGPLTEEEEIFSLLEEYKD